MDFVLIFRHLTEEATGMTLWLELDQPDSEVSEFESEELIIVGMRCESEG